MFPGVPVPGQDQAFGTSQALKEAITAALEVPLLSALLPIQHHHCSYARVPPHFTLFCQGPVVVGIQLE